VLVTEGNLEFLCNRDMCFRLLKPFCVLDFDFLHHIGENYQTLRRYIVEFLNVLKLRATPSATELLEAINFIRKLYLDNGRKIPADAPISFIKKRWGKLVFTVDGIHRYYYEICVLSELKNALRSGDNR
jgi:hypothetical protein